MTETDPTGLSAPLRDSLLLIANEVDRDRVNAEIAEHIVQLASEQIEVPTIALEELKLDDWESGVEAFQAMSLSEVMQFLGLKEDQPVFYFNDVIDRLGEHDPWVNKEPQDPETVIPLRLLWHQAVGIAKMLLQLFEGKPTLLMDSVGLGKTMQVVGVIALLVYFREYKTANGVYPGGFSKFY